MDHGVQQHVRRDHNLRELLLLVELLKLALHLVGPPLVAVFDLVQLRQDVLLGQARNEVRRLVLLVVLIADLLSGDLLVDVIVRQKLIGWRLVASFALLLDLLYDVSRIVPRHFDHLLETVVVHADFGANVVEVHFCDFGLDQFLEDYVFVRLAQFVFFELTHFEVDSGLVAGANDISKLADGTQLQGRLEPVDSRVNLLFEHLLFFRIL